MRFGFWHLLLLLTVGLPPIYVAAHPMVEHALDITIEPHRVVIDARISMEQVLLVAGAANSKMDEGHRGQLIAEHAAYVLGHLKVRSGDQVIAGSITPDSAKSAHENAPAVYHLEFPLTAPPKTIRVDQNFLREHELWSASCIVRIRQRDDAAFETGLLTRQNSIVFDCVWPDGTTTRPAMPRSEPAITTIRLWPTVRAYTAHGIKHILTGYDHLLFVSALVLAAVKLWDLIKVVTAFTIAHTMTLVLSVFGIVTLTERVVEPMIAASIIFVAVQNIFWPRQSRGWTRLAVAFGFGLFHGLGFAGGLRDAMADMPRAALWVALISFSVGVEVGHQIVVLPLFGALSFVRREKELPSPTAAAGRILKFGSAAISVAGVYFLIQALGQR
jgi:hydrogenase/urease accessory protein HupE